MQPWLITGAGRGIGWALARELRSRGVPVVATVRRADDGIGLAAIGARVVCYDARLPGSAERVAEELGDAALFGVVHNAGIMGAREPLGALSAADLMDVFAVDAVAPLLLTQALLPHLERGAGRRLVFVTSRMGSMGDNQSGGAYAYRAAKAALNAAAVSLSRDLGPKGFVCLCLHPGWVRTEMGGPGAPLSAEESARLLLERMERSGPAENGRFLGPNGEEIPW